MANQTSTCALACALDNHWIIEFFQPSGVKIFKAATEISSTGHDPLPKVAALTGALLEMQDHLHLSLPLIVAS